MSAAPSFGARIRSLRRDRQLSQRALALLVGVDHAQLSRFERGLTPSLGMAARLADALGVERDQMLVLAAREVAPQ